LLVVRWRDRPAIDPPFKSQGVKRPTSHCKRKIVSIFRFLSRLAPHFPHSDDAGRSHFRNNQTTRFKNRFYAYD
jgi:hypothetical protein